MNPAQLVHSIVVVGGGVAGSALARALDALRTPGLQVTVVSDEPGVAPLHEVLDLKRGDCFVKGRVTDVDLPAQSLRCHTLAGNLCLRYDQLVLAFGNRARLDLIPGMALHAMPLKTASDALHMRNVVQRRLARIEVEHDPDLRRETGHFVVIGGAFAGVEAAGELIDCLARTRRLHPRVRDDEIQVTLLHDTDRLLPEMSPRLAAAALRSLRRRGVVVDLNARVTKIHERGVALADGRTLAAHSVISTIGTRPNSLVAQLGLASEHGRLQVEPDLALAGHPGVWALGDCAFVRDVHDHCVLPPNAQLVARQACVLAANLLAHRRDEPTRRFSARPLGAVAAIGRRNAVAEVLGVGFSGLPAWLLWRAHELARMPLLPLRTWVERTRRMFSAAGVRHPRFTRSADLPAHERGTSA
jgi:NADH dehydrogenase